MLTEPGFLFCSPIRSWKRLVMRRLSGIIIPGFHAILFFLHFNLKSSE